MLEWFTVLQMVIASVLTLLALILALLRKAPNDLTMGVLLLSVLGLLAQMVIAFIAPLAGNPPSGDLLEYWMYLVVALLMLLGGGFYALIDRKPQAHWVLVLLAASLVVMLYRMAHIWGIWV